MKPSPLAPLAVFFALIVGSVASVSVSNAATLQLTGASLTTYSAKPCQTAIAVHATDLSGNGNKAEAIAIIATPSCAKKSFVLSIRLEKNERPWTVTVDGDLNDDGFKKVRVDQFKPDEVTDIVLTIDGWPMTSTWSKLDRY